MIVVHSIAFLSAGAGEEFSFCSLSGEAGSDGNCTFLFSSLASRSLSGTVLMGEGSGKCLYVRLFHE